MPIENPIEGNNFKECIVCKNSLEGGRLYYLSKIRHSKTLIKTFLDVDYPLIIITTCGHVVHKNCLASNELKCILCQKKTNFLFPFTKADEFLSKEEFSNCL